MARTKIYLVILLFFLSAFMQDRKGDAIYYVSLNDAIYQGQYDGSISIKELKAHGDFGVGSAAKLLGELVMLDGTAYLIPASGKATEMPPDTKIPYAAVKFFKADAKARIAEEMTQSQFEGTLDSLIRDNTFAAIRVKGEFSSVEYRSFEPQKKPYEPLKKAKKVNFDRENVRATLVGFYTPEAAAVLNSPVYHFHFVTDDKSTGGHVLDYTIKNATIEIDYSRELVVNLPPPELLQHIDLNKQIDKN